MPSNSYILVNEPSWKKHKQGSMYRMPPIIQSWVYEKKSLTQRLKKYYGQTFAVKVVYQQWTKPYLNESLRLQENNRQYCLVREVMLLSGDIALIKARTIIPSSTLQGSQRILSRLGNRPLGEVIFSYPKLQRLTLDIAQINLADHGQNSDSSDERFQKVWGRRTLYAISGRRLLVCEFFLPDLIKTESV